VLDKSALNEISNPNALVAFRKGIRGSETLHQQNSPLLNWTYTFETAVVFRSSKSRWMQY